MAINFPDSPTDGQVFTVTDLAGNDIEYTYNSTKDIWFISASGVQGPEGPAGPAGPEGPAGGTGISIAMAIIFG